LKRAWRQIKSGARSADETRFENEEMDFHRSIRKGYLDIAKEEPDRFAVIDASQNPEFVKGEILKKLSEFLSSR